MYPISLLNFSYTYFYLLNYASKDHLLTTHTYNDIYETELRRSYRSPFCISVIKSDDIYEIADLYQVRRHF